MSDITKIALYQIAYLVLKSLKCCSISDKLEKSMKIGEVLEETTVGGGKTENFKFPMI
jgi:hypothetical protein